MSFLKHIDFYRWLEEREYQRYWNEWTPELWDPESLSFNSNLSYGYDKFIDAIDDSDISYQELFEDFLASTPRILISELIKEVKKEAERFFQLGWRKCVLVGRISQEDESGLIELFRFIKTWQGLKGTVRLVSAYRGDTPQVEDLSLESVPDHIPVVPSKRYLSEDGWRYDTPKLLQRKFGKHFWVQFENPEKIQAPLVSFFDGVIMAIPANMIPSEFQELATKTENYLGLLKYTEVQDV